MKDNLMAKKKKQISLIFLLSLITHLILILLIINFAFKKSKKQETKVIFLNEEKKENNIPASLKPKKSEFGTTQLFDDTPQFTPQKTKKLTLKTENNINNQTKGKKEVPQKIKKTKKTTKDKSDIPIHKTAKTTFIKKEAILEQKITGSDRITQKGINKQIELSKNIQTLKTFGKSTKDATPKPDKRKSILSMTQGYLYNKKNKGNDWLERKGDDNKTPCFDDLRNQSYNTRIAQALQNDISIIFSQMTFEEKRNFFKGLKLNPVIFFKLNKKGFLIEVLIIRSSGSQIYDYILLKAFKQASPFPEIPNHLNKKTFEQVYEIKSNNLIRMAQKIR